MMSICFIGFLIGCFSRTQYIINRFVLQECGDFTWSESDCEELVGVNHRRWCDWPCDEY